MRNLKQILKTTEKLLIDNSPMIMTSIGVAGAITTAVMTGQATVKAVRLIDAQQPAEWEKNQNGKQELTRKEKLELTWKLYIPAVGVGGITVFAIISANRIGTRRAAAMAAAYTISEKAFTEYKDKVVEHIGANKEQKIRDEIAQDRVNRTPMERVIVTDSTMTECFDAFSGRYWPCDMETIRQAMNDINFEILHNDFATVSEYYKKVGLKPTAVSDELGWNTDKKLELSFSSTLKEEKGKPTIPVLVVDFARVPINEPWRFC